MPWSLGTDSPVGAEGLLPLKNEGFACTFVFSYYSIKMMCFSCLFCCCCFSKIAAQHTGEMSEIMITGCC